MRTTGLLGALAALLFLAAPAALADAYLRVISQTAPIHSGPGSGYREIYMAARGDVYEVLERGTKGYWFRVELEDGTPGWVFGELVFPFEVVESDDPGVFTRMYRATRRAILGPSPVPYAHWEISVSAGVLDEQGLFLFRPGYLVDKHLSIDGFFGISPRAQEDVFLGGLGMTLRMIPGAAIGPYIQAAAGAGYLRPKADNFTDEEELLMALAAGGGFEITFKKQITLRADFRNWTLFDQDQADNAQEYSGGLAIFF